MNKELLYDNEKEYWLDVQLNTTECDKCGIDMDVMKSIPVKFKNKYYTGLGFVCSSCFKKE